MRQKILKLLEKAGGGVWTHVHLEGKNLSCAEIFYITSNDNIYKMGLIIKIDIIEYCGKK